MAGQVESEGAGRRTSVGIVTIFPTPYRQPFFERLGKNPSLNTKVYFCARDDAEWRWDEELEARFEHEYMPLVQLAGKGAGARNFRYNPGAAGKLKKARHEVIVIAGYFFLTYMWLIIWCILTRRKFILWVESHELRPRTRLKLAIKRFVIKPIFRRSSAFLAMGRNTKAYLNSYGVEDDRIFFVPNTPDIDALSEAHKELAPKKDEFKAEIGVGGKSVILYAGRFAREKGLEYLIEAFGIVKAEQPDAALVLAGRGPLEDKLKSLVKEKSLDDVIFAGFVNYRDLPKYYCLADVFVLPSLDEPWGVVVNEAMAFGLPVVLSSQVGAAADLVVEGKNGFTVPPRDPDALAKAIIDVLGDKDTRDKMGKISAEIIRGFDYSAGEKEFVNAVNKAVKGAVLP